MTIFARVQGRGLVGEAREKALARSLVGMGVAFADQYEVTVDERCSTAGGDNRRRMGVMDAESA